MRISLQKFKKFQNLMDLESRFKALSAKSKVFRKRSSLENKAKPQFFKIQRKLPPNHTAPVVITPAHTRTMAIGQRQTYAIHTRLRGQSQAQIQNLVLQNPSKIQKNRIQPNRFKIQGKHRIQLRYFSFKLRIQPYKTYPHTQILRQLQNPKQRF